MPAPFIDTGFDEALGRGLNLGLQAANMQDLALYRDRQADIANRRADRQESRDDDIFQIATMEADRKRRQDAQDTAANDYLVSEIARERFPGIVAGEMGPPDPDQQQEMALYDAETAAMHGATDDAINRYLEQANRTTLHRKFGQIAADPNLPDDMKRSAMEQIAMQLAGTKTGGAVLRMLGMEDQNARAKAKSAPPALESVEAVRGLYGDASANLFAQTGEIRVPRGTPTDPAKVAAFTAIAEDLSTKFPAMAEVFQGMATAGINPLSAATFEKDRMNFERLARPPASPREKRVQGMTHEQLAAEAAGGTGDTRIDAESELIRRMQNMDDNTLLSYTREQVDGGGSNRPAVRKAAVRELRDRGLEVKEGRFWGAPTLTPAKKPAAAPTAQPGPAMSPDPAPATAPDRAPMQPLPQGLLTPPGPPMQAAPPVADPAAPQPDEDKAEMALLELSASVPGFDPQTNPEHRALWRQRIEQLAQGAR